MYVMSIDHVTCIINIIIYSDSELCLVPATSIVDKCVIMEVQNELRYVFVSVFPNSAEVE